VFRRFEFKDERLLWKSVLSICQWASMGFETVGEMLFVIQHGRLLLNFVKKTYIVCHIDP